MTVSPRGPAALCARFGYPDEIRAHLEAIVAVVERWIPGRDLRALVLFGSTARGEASYRSADTGLDLFSDYEMLLVTRAVRTPDMRPINDEIDALTRQWAITNPFFHVDIGTNTLPQLYLKAPVRRNIANYEFWENGFPLTGRPLTRLPWWSGVTSRQLEPASTNELVIERLRQELGYLLAEPAGTPAEQREWRSYVAARNALDTLTVFLPSQGQLIPGYEARARAFDEGFRGRGYFLPEQEEYLERALEVKLTLDLTDPPEWAESRMLGAYLSLASYLAHGRPAPSDAKDPVPVAAAMTEGGREAFAESSVSRGLRQRRERRLAAALGLGSHWHRQEKRPDLMALMLLVTHAIVARRAGHVPAAGTLEMALSLAGQLTGPGLVPGSSWDAVARWSLALAGVMRGKVAARSAISIMRNNTAE